jgi:hypothetical protein
VVAALLAPGQVESLAEDVEQRLPVVDVDLVLAAVDMQPDAARRVVDGAASLSAAISPSVFRPGDRGRLGAMRSLGAAGSLDSATAILFYA